MALLQNRRRCGSIDHQNRFIHYNCLNGAVHCTTSDRIRFPDNARYFDVHILAHDKLVPIRHLFLHVAVGSRSRDDFSEFLFV